MFGWGRRRRQAEVGETASSEESIDEQDLPEGGPYDEADAPADGLERLDLGSVRLPVPDGSQLQVEVDPAGPVRAVHLITPVGRLTVGAYAAPKTSELWPEVSNELVEQLRKDGAQVRRENGDWGTELVAESPNAMLRFVGVDGPRWMLRGVSAGPAEHVEAARKLLYSLIEETIVVRGDEPLPVRTPLPIVLPEPIARHINQAQPNGQSQ